MPNIRVSNTVHSRLKGRAEFEWCETGTCLGNEWLIPISQETLDALNEHKLPGETYTDLLTRLLDWADAPDYGRNN